MCFLPITITGNYQSVAENNYGHFVGLRFLLWLGDAVEHSAGSTLVG